jgi:hypothetical protein
VGALRGPASPSNRSRHDLNHAGLCYLPRPLDSAIILGVERKPNSHLRDAHSVWEKANQAVRASERELAQALSDYQAGNGPLPADLLEHVQALRTDCNAKFKVLMTALSYEGANPGL